MIMPAHPRAGDVYRTENIPGLVFEEVTVERVGETLRGPTGIVHGALVGRELHMDERRLEEKVFAPGYGEFFSGGGRTYEATALVVPADADAGPVPAYLRTLLRSAVDAASGHGDVRRVRRAAGTVHGEPPRLEAALRRAVAALEPRAAARSALNVADAALDLQLRYRPPRAIDEQRLRLWRLRLSLDTAAGNRAGDRATLRLIRARIP
jgi:hypothetical protein